MKVGTTLVFMAMIVAGMSNVTFGYYNQSLGRWTSEDPLGTDPAGGLHGNAFVTTTQYDDGVSLYNYVGGYSLIAGDPYGLEYVVNGHMPPYMDSTTARVPWWAWLPQGGAGRIALRNIRASAMLLAGQWNARGWTEAGTALLNYVTAGNSISVSYAKMLKEAGRNKGVKYIYLLTLGV